MIFCNFKVVPLSRKSGILQWCDNTLPLSSYLIGGKEVKGAHAKYHPEDYTYVQCVEKYRVNIITVKTPYNILTFKIAKYLSHCTRFVLKWYLFIALDCRYMRSRRVES